MVLPPITPVGVFSVKLSPTQVTTGAGYTGVVSVTPPPVNPPIFFEPPGILTNNDYELWIIVTGPPPNWGGARVYASVDPGGTGNYGEIATVPSGGVQGTLTAPYPSGPDPDTSDVLSVNVAESGGTIPNATAADANAGVTVAYVDGELVGYSTVTLTSTYHYNLTTYLRRGMYTTAVGSHAAGSSFGLVNGAVVKLSYTSQQVGLTVWFKFPSVNPLGLNEQSLADCIAYPYKLLGLSHSPTGGGMICAVDIGLAAGCSEDWGYVDEVVSCKCDWGLVGDPVTLQIDLGTVGR